MKTFITPFLLAASATAIAIDSRDINTVTNDLYILDTDYRNISSQVDAWDGGAGSAIGYYHATNYAIRDTNKTTADVRASSPFSIRDGVNLYYYLNQTLQPDVNRTLNTIVANKAKFRSSGFVPVITNQLKTLQNDTATLGQALEDNVRASGLATVYEKMFAVYDRNFNIAIDGVNAK